MSRIYDLGAAPGRPGGAATEDTAAVTGFLAELRSLGEGEAPAPTPELQALFDGVPSIRPARRVRAPLLRRVALIAAAAVIGTTAAAAGHGLPQPAQQVVSDVVNTITPFHIGEDDGLPPHRAPQYPPAHRPGASSDNEGVGDGARSGQGGDEGESGDQNEAAGPAGAAIGSAGNHHSGREGGRGGAAGAGDDGGAGAGAGDSGGAGAGDGGGDGGD